RTMKLGYRSDEEIATWRARDPLERTGVKLEAAERERIDGEVDASLDEAVEFARRSPQPDPESALDHMVASGVRPRSGVSP
ncbi:MAG: thiamine pyrophosphate-dependent dehydrogenase E1 component subunit alpha, partial [Actinobacteria bacterium]|nr:thiamine pyrophosphate-dependent dehydrogenase E1 component subunit alpha [Actinomycetota bacterium]